MHLAVSTILCSSFVALHCLCAPLPSRQKAQSGSRHTTVKIPSGQYRGLYDEETSTTVYYGIPYAVAGRFDPPEMINVSIEAINQTIDATSHGPSCINFEIPPPYDIGFATLKGNKAIEPQSEDCLTMDIYVPKQEPLQSLPVLFFTPGGGLLLGASFSYDMRPLVKRSIEIDKPFIGVVINYRLGPLGFLNPSTSENTNLGFSDQSIALRFVNENIKYFGGDADKVTIMGQSAGAESMMHQRLFGDTTNFRGAWLASVPSSGAPFLQKEPHYKDELIYTYSKACGCNNETLTERVECLRKADINTLVNASIAYQGSGSSLDGRFIRENVFSALRDHKKLAKIPTVITSCRDEGTSAAIGFKADSDQVTDTANQILINTSKNFNRERGASFSDQMLKAYPDVLEKGCPFDGKNISYGEPSQYKRMAAIMTDSQYVGAWMEYLHQFAKSGAPTWGLSFEEPIPGLEEGETFGVQHGSDLVFYFPNILGHKSDPRRCDKTARLANHLQTALIHFVVESNPTTEDNHWPQYDHKDHHSKVLALSTEDRKGIVGLPYRAGFKILHEFLWST